MPVGPHLILTSYTITDPAIVGHSLSFHHRLCEKSWSSNNFHLASDCSMSEVIIMQSLATINDINSFNIRPTEYYIPGAVEQAKQ